MVLDQLLSTDYLYPTALFIAIPAILILLWLTRRSFVRDDPRYDDAKGIRRRSHLRWTVFVLRSIIVLCLIIAIATPLIQQNIIRAGDAHITVVIDNSSSMAVLDTDFTANLLSELRNELPVTVHTIAPGERSPLGDGVLASLRPNENVLLISDGYSNEGPVLAEVAAFANQRNSTISAIRLESRVDDAAIIIDAPSKIVADTNTTFAVEVSRSEDFPVQVRVTIDDQEVFNDRLDESSIQFTQTFSAGAHRLSAEIPTEDALPQNNRYDFLLTAVEKPRVLLVTQKTSGFQPLLSQLYTVTVSPTLPRTAEELEQYYAIVLVDVPVSTVSGAATNALTNYLLAGNGVLVVGGPNSFDYGGYKNSVFESLLPVEVGSAKEGGGVANIVLAVDMSGSVSGAYARDETGKLVYKQSDKPALIRSLAISVLDDIDNNNNLGVVVIGGQSANATQNIREPGEVFQWDYVGGPALGRVSQLGPKRDPLADAIATLQTSSAQGGGQAASQYWIAAPQRALESTGGSKNIIVLTDGQSCSQNCRAAGGGSDEAATINLARTVAAQGGRVYVVGVEDGRNEDFMMALAQAGNGIFFSATERNKLRILFGDPDQENEASAFGLVVLDSNHFITRGVDLQATVYGFNEVIPKAYSSLLVTAGNGQPALTTWQYGVGRVATLTAYNGNDYGELLHQGNSMLISRAGNWIIGDPERKQEYSVTVPPLHVGEQGIITVQSKRIPSSGDSLVFTLAGKDLYEATYTPEAIGFSTVDGIPYASNYAREYERVGLNPALEATISSAGGRLFNADDVEGIVEHVQTVRSLQEVRKEPLRYPFLLAAAILFLIEVALRRLYELRRKS